MKQDRSPDVSQLRFLEDSALYVRHYEVLKRKEKRVAAEVTGGGFSDLFHLLHQSEFSQSAAGSMKVTSLCTTQLMNVLLLAAQLHLTDADFPLVVPPTQQLFKDEGLSVSCEGLDGLTGWRVMKKVKGVIKPCADKWDKSPGPCQITTAYPEHDNGEYWCEIGAKKSDTVNITVSDRSVILESPVHPVTEGENVTLRCRNKTNSSNLPATFFKDKDVLGSSSTGEMTLHTISKSNEGLYKCRFSESGESAESWLPVRESTVTVSVPFPFDWRILIGVAVVLVLLLVGLFLCRNHQTVTTDTPSSIQSSSSPQSVLEQASVAAPMEATYALITKPKRQEAAGVSSATDDYHFYHSID